MSILPHLAQSTLCTESLRKRYQELLQDVKSTSSQKNLARKPIHPEQGPILMPNHLSFQTVYNPNEMSSFISLKGWTNYIGHYTQIKIRSEKTGNEALTLAGMIIDQSADSITIVNAQGKKERLPFKPGWKFEILIFPEHEKLKTSLMLKERVKIPPEKIARMKKVNPNPTFHESDLNYQEINEEIKEVFEEQFFHKFINGEKKLTEAFVSKYVSQDIINLLKDSGLKADMNNISWDEIVSTIRNKYQKLIADGVVTENQVLDPALMIVYPNGVRAAISYGEKIPDGARIYEGIIENKEFLYLLSQGKFVIGLTKDAIINASNVRIKTSTFVHDIIHLSDIYADPMYGKKIIEMSEAILAENGHATYGFFEALEGFSRVDNQKLIQNADLFITSVSQKPLRVYELIENYHKVPLAEVIEKAKKLRSQAKDLLIQHGGVLRDPRYLEEVDGRSEDLYEAFFQQLDPFLNQAPEEIDTELFFTALAKAEGALIYTKDIKAHEWVEAFMAPYSQKPQTRVYKALCVTSVLTEVLDPSAPTQRFFHKLCKSE